MFLMSHDHYIILTCALALAKNLSVWTSVSEATDLYTDGVLLGQLNFNVGHVFNRNIL